jgi:chromate transporter
MNPVTLFCVFFKASLFSTGGMGNVPAIHADLLARGWATDRQFAEALAVGQVSPGPNGLWVISLGYLTDGLRGALLALAAISLPPLLVLALDRLYARVKDHPAVEGFVRGLGLAVIGIFVVVLADLLRSSGADFRSGIIALAAIGLALTRRVPVFAVIALAALFGVVFR